MVRRRRLGRGVWVISVCPSYIGKLPLYFVHLLLGEIFKGHHLNPIRIGPYVVGTDLDAYRGDAIVGAYVGPPVPQKSLRADDVPLLIHRMTPVRDMASRTNAPFYLPSAT